MLAYERFLVLNIFLVRELTKRLPANSPVIADPPSTLGYCKSQLGRNLSPVYRILGKVVEALFARTVEEGSRQLCGLRLVVPGVSSSCAAGM